jgi:hypothetical protein
MVGCESRTLVKIHPTSEERKSISASAQERNKIAMKTLTPANELDIDRIRADLPILTRKSGLE